MSRRVDDCFGKAEQRGELSEVFLVGSVPSPNHGNRCRIATKDEREVPPGQEDWFSEVGIDFQEQNPKCR